MNYLFWTHNTWLTRCVFFLPGGFETANPAFKRRMNDTVVGPNLDCRFKRYCKCLKRSQRVCWIFSIPGSFCWKSIWVNHQHFQESDQFTLLSGQSANPHHFLDWNLRNPTRIHWFNRTLCPKLHVHWPCTVARVRRRWIVLLVSWMQRSSRKQLVLARRTCGWWQDPEATKTQKQASISGPHPKHPQTRAL